MNGKLLYIVSKNIKRVNHLYVENEKKMHYRMNSNCCGATRHRRRRRWQRGIWLWSGSLFWPGYRPYHIHIDTHTHNSSVCRRWCGETLPGGGAASTLKVRQFRKQIFMFSLIWTKKQTKLSFGFCPSLYKWVQSKKWTDFIKLIRGYLM